MIASLDLTAIYIQLYEVMVVGLKKLLLLLLLGTLVALPTIAGVQTVADENAILQEVKKHVTPEEWAEIKNYWLKMRRTDGNQIW